MPNKRDYLVRKETPPEDDNWSHQHILVIVICVLASVIICFIIRKVYVLCKKHRKRPTARNQRHGYCCFHTCDRGHQYCTHSATPQGIQTSPYTPSALHTYIPRQLIPPCQSTDHVHHMPTAMDVPADHYRTEYGGHPGARQIQTLSRSVPMTNPVYAGSVGGSESLHTIDQDGPPNALKDLYKDTLRSFTQTVCGKLLVSIARKVGHKGDVLYLDNMGISLHVPEGAIQRGDEKLIVLVLNWDLSDNPLMKREESLVSPVVYVGPHGLKLDKPCTLTFRHCAFDPRQIQIMRSETELIEPKDWSALCNQSDDSGLCYLTPDECQLKIDTFTLYTCVQGPLDNCLGKKWLQIAVFACPLRKEINHHQVRMYFLNKTNCALQWAIQNEASFGGRLICPEKVFLFDGNELDMFTETRYISNGWELVGPESSEKISFLQIWHGQCPHISICFRRSNVMTSRTNTVAIEMSLRVFTFQQTLEDSGEKIFIQVFEDNKAPLTENELRCNHQIDIQINNFGTSQGSSSRVGSQGYNGAEMSAGLQGRGLSGSVSDSCHNGEIESRNSDNVTLVINNQFTACSSRTDHPDAQMTADTKSRLFPQSLRNRLILLLDPPKAPYGNDWKDLAAKLNLDSCIPKLQTHENPTNELLNCIESQRFSYTDVISLFRDIGREDCVGEIVKHLNTETAETNCVGSREASEHTCRQSDDNNEDFPHRSEGYSSTGSSSRDDGNWWSQDSSLKYDSNTFSKDTT